MNAHSHWDHIYQTKKPTQMSWFRPHLEKSLELIASAAGSRDASIIDVGGGESTLVDDLLDQGYRDLSVLDISRTAIDVTRNRLGERANSVSWLAADITAIKLPKQHYDVWHDRAVFHFLTNSADRVAYVRQVRESVKIGGHVIVASFGPEGPLRCSGLEVVRYDAETLHGEFGGQFQLVRHLTEQHDTPFGSTQQFVYCYCKLSS
jgi:2-polyprenyl-3-methyl-5-hydroxy-6-metoxy-1,4-benzoquinol methylase